MLLYLITNMAAVTSRAKQQYPHQERVLLVVKGTGSR